jgi:M6 family metalloprotease-like protein
MLLVTLLLPTVAAAVPSAEEPYALTQADGASLIAVTKGNEWSNHTETDKGFTIVRQSDGNWYYVTGFSGAVPVVSAVRADQPAPAQLTPGLAPAHSSNAPPAGENAQQMASKAPIGVFSGKILFILAQHTNRTGVTSEASWATFIQNKIAAYYNKVSNGKVTLTPANETCGTANNGVVPWVNVGATHPNTGGGTGIANQTLTKNAILASNACVNYAAYDTNNDGFVDSNELAIVVIVAGYERSFSGAYTPSVWGHKWSIAAAPTVDGKIVGAYHAGAGGYAQFGELHRSTAANQHQATMGIMVHELGHLIFGLPDLYDIDGSSSGIGAFGLMGAGSWGKKAADPYSGATPVDVTGWTKYKRGWSTGAVGSGTRSITASGSASATSANTVFRATTPTAGEYFLVQNRQNVGYDQGLQRWFGAGFTGGLNIWHIDDNLTTNANDAHRWVDVEEADNTQMGLTRGSNNDLWRLGNATTFNGASAPNSNRYSGAASGVNISNISATGNVMQACFGAACGGGGTAKSVITSPTPGSTLAGTTVTFRWSNVGAAQYWLYVGTTGVGSRNKYSASQGTGLARTITGLPTAGFVYVRIWTRHAGRAWAFNDYRFTAGGGGVGFNEQFNGTTAPNWRSASGVWTLRNSAWLTSTGRSNLASHTVYIRNFANMDYSVRMWRSTRDQFANRMVVRASGAVLADGNHSNEYLFQYSSNGMFSVWKRVAGGYIMMKTWTASAVINQGAAWNVLRVTATGSAFNYFINGTLVWSGTDTSLARGMVGAGFYRNAVASSLYIDYAVLTGGTLAPPAGNTVLQQVPPKSVVTTGHPAAVDSASPMTASGVQVEAQQEIPPSNISNQGVIPLSPL